MKKLLIIASVTLIVSCTKTEYSDNHICKNQYVVVTDIVTGDTINIESPVKRCDDILETVEKQQPVKMNNTVFYKNNLSDTRHPYNVYADTLTPLYTNYYTWSTTTNSYSVLVIQRLYYDVKVSKSQLHTNYFK